MKKTSSANPKAAQPAVAANDAAPKAAPATAARKRPAAKAARAEAATAASAPAKAVKTPSAAKTAEPAQATETAKAAKAATSAKAAKTVKAAKATGTAKRAKAAKAVQPAAKAPVPAVEPAAEPKPAARRAPRAAAKARADTPAEPSVQPPAKTAARRAPARLPALPIFQIYFQPGQLPGLDAAFVPLDNAGRDHPLREFAVFERLAAQPALQGVPLWGAMSWRFGEKTGLTGDALLQAVAAKPGQDLYYCNPYPEHEALYINGWQQGVPSHPAFTELCAAVLKAAGLDEAELRAVQGSREFSACNYFVGSPAFWRAYLPWVRGVVDRARAALPAGVLRVLDSPLSDPKGMHAGSTYWPFIVERLLPLFLRQAGRGLKVHKITLPASEARMNIHLQRLREMKDMACRSKSRWLYGCWLNYRNLYLLQTAGAAWCKRYLPKINATEFDFR